MESKGVSCNNNRKGNKMKRKEVKSTNSLSSIPQTIVIIIFIYCDN